MRRFVPLAGAALLLGVYLLTMAPTLSWSHHGADGGDLVTAVARGSIPHPPGFATYLLLGDLFIRLPLRDPAWRLNLLSAVAAAGTVGLTIAAVRRLRSSSSILGALCAGLCLGLAPLFWSQALIAEVYTVAALFSALVVLLVLAGAPPWALGLAWGVGIGAHPTLVFLAPLVAYGAWNRTALHDPPPPGLSSSQGGPPHRRAGFVVGGSAQAPSAPCWCRQLLNSHAHNPDSSVAQGRDRLFSREGPPHGPTLLGLTSPHRGEQWRGPVWRVLAAALAALIGLGVMVGPVLLARASAPSPWADLSAFDGWWALVSGRLYRGYVFALPAPAWPRRLLAWVGLLARQFTPLGALLAAVGWARLWQERKGLAAATLASFGAFSLHALGYDTTDSVVYLVPTLPLAAVWLGVGLDEAGGWLAERLREGGWRDAARLGTAVFLLLPLVQAALSWRAMDVSGDRTAMAWAEDVLEEAPPAGVLLTGRDAHTFTLWYAQEVLGQRPDVVVVDRDMWGHAPYRRMMAAELGMELDTLSPEQAARRARRPLVEVRE